MISNPFVGSAPSDGLASAGSNFYYRKIEIENILLGFLKVVDFSKRDSSESLFLCQKKPTSGEGCEPSI